MNPRYEATAFEIDSDLRILTAGFTLVNNSGARWKQAESCIGYQLFDADSGLFLAEGDWTTLDRDLAPAETERIQVLVHLPPEKGRYHVFISPRSEPAGWAYVNGAPFLLVQALVEGGKARLGPHRVTTLGRLRRSQRISQARSLFSLPLRSLWRHRSLIRSMVRREILARYRGSFADIFWTVLNPLLLTLTYFFVFGIVLESRFGPDQSRTGFALYFLAGMLPWFAFSEALARAPHVIPEHRNFVKKLVFPLEILPFNITLAGLVTEAFALVIFLVALAAIRGSVPVSTLWLPVLVAPQILLTAGLAWGLAAISVFLRDLAHVMGLLLTLWFFLTPICYPESSLPAAAAAILSRNPMYFLVRGYRQVLLEGNAPSMALLLKLWALGIVAFFVGHALFHKLRKSFADVI